MNLPKDVAKMFYTWVERYYGIKVNILDPPRQGQHARFMLGENIVVVRDFYGVPETAGEVWEVWCGDKEKLNEMSKLFCNILERVAEAAKESQNEESNN